MTGLEVAVGLLIGWFARRARRVGGRVDETTDEAVDKGLDRVCELIVGKLGDEPALGALRRESVDTGDVTARTRLRVQLALEEVAEEDEAFAAELNSAVEAAQSGTHGIIVSGNVVAASGSVAIGVVTGFCGDGSQDDSASLTYATEPVQVDDDNDR